MHRPMSCHSCSRLRRIGPLRTFMTAPHRGSTKHQRPHPVAARAEIPSGNRSLVAENRRALQLTDNGSHRRGARRAWLHVDEFGYRQLESVCEASPCDARRRAQRTAARPTSQRRSPQRAARSASAAAEGRTARRSPALAARSAPRSGSPNTMAPHGANALACRAGARVERSPPAPRNAHRRVGLSGGSQ